MGKLMKYFSMIAVVFTLCACEVSIPNDVNVSGNINLKDKELQLRGQTQTISKKISNEQDFEAVANAQTLESDAERIAANRAKYIVIDVRDLPERANNLPNVVEYAIRTNNLVGVQLYKRFGTSAKTFSSGGCGKFSSTDSAQQAFLVRGGPKIDALGIDPDGDGFACAWDPRPFRAAVLN